MKKYNHLFICALMLLSIDVTLPVVESGWLFR